MTMMAVTCDHTNGNCRHGNCKGCEPCGDCAAEERGTKYKTARENFNDTLTEARKMTKKEIKVVLRQRLALHGWAVRAYEQALEELETTEVLK